MAWFCVSLEKTWHAYYQYTRNLQHIWNLIMVYENNSVNAIVKSGISCLGRLHEKEPSEAPRGSVLLGNCFTAWVLTSMPLSVCAPCWPASVGLASWLAFVLPHLHDLLSCILLSLPGAVGQNSVGGSMTWLISSFVPCFWLWLGYWHCLHLDSTTQKNWALLLHTALRLEACTAVILNCETSAL